MRRKDETYWNILNCALRLDFKKGHRRWTMTELGRSAQVTRSLIYYYFGKSKDSILADAVKLVGEELFGLNPDRLALWDQGSIEESVYRSRVLTEKNPNLVAFYFAHRSDESSIGHAIRELEGRHMKKLRSFLPNASDEFLEALMGLFIGLVTAPKISRKAIGISVQLAIGATRDIVG